MNRTKPKRLGRRKVIPLHFRKRSVSLSQCLQAASAQQRCRQLLQNNKDLASALETAQNNASASHEMLQNYVRDSNQILLAKLKLREMACTIQKLVGDLNDVITCLDETNSNGIRRIFNDNMRMRVQAPDVSDIAESDRSSYGKRDNEEMEENEKSPVKKVTEDSSTFQLDSLLSKINESQTLLSKNFEKAEKNSKKDKNTADSSSFFDSSLTEIYNVQQLLSKKDPLAVEHSKIDDVVETPSPPTPQLNLPKRERFHYSLTEVDYSKELKSVTQQKPANSNNSKIPRPKQNLYCEAQDSPIAPNFGNRRETFVVKKILDSDQNECLLSSGRRETFTIQEISKELQSPNKNMRPKVDDFKQPFSSDPSKFFKPTELSTLKSIKLSSLPQETLNICFDDQTKLINEDMDLTEVMPSAAVSNFAYCTNESKISVEDICNDQEIKTNEIKNQASDLKVRSPISPIEKINTRSTLIKSNPLILSKPKTIELNKIGYSQESNENINELETKVYPKSFDKSSKTKSSRKSILTKQNYCSKQPNKSSDVMLPDLDLESDLNMDVNHTLPSTAQKTCLHSYDKNNSNLSPSPPLNYNDTVKKSLKGSSNIKSKKSIATDYDSALNYSTSEPVSSDSDLEFIIDLPKKKVAPRIPNRKSLHENRKKRFVFIRTEKERKSNYKTEGIAVDVLTSANEKTYNFSSASDDDLTQESKASKKYSKQKRKVSKNKIEKNTVAVLERDINLQYQNQCRKKRSLKRRVSFANVQSTPTNSDEEDCKKTNEMTALNTNALEKQSFIRKNNQSLKRRVSFANVRSTPTNSDEEDNKKINEMITSNFESIEKHIMTMKNFTNPTIDNKAEKAYISRPSILKKAKLNYLHEGEESPFIDTCTSSEEVVKVNEEPSTVKSTSDMGKCLGSVSENDKISSIGNAKKPINLEISEEISKSTIKEKNSTSKQKRVKKSNIRNVEERISEKVIVQNDNSKKSHNSPSASLKTSVCNSSNSTPVLLEKASAEVMNKSQSETYNSYVINPFPVTKENSSNDAEKSSSFSSAEKDLAKKNSRQHSELFSFANKRSTRSKRTFSGVSERSSKKRVTENDDFLEEMNDVEINLIENQNLQIDSKFERDIKLKESSNHAATHKETILNNQPILDSSKSRSDMGKDKLVSNATVALSEIQNTSAGELNIIKEYEKTELAALVPKKSETRAKLSDKLLKHSKPKKKSSTKPKRSGTNSKAKNDVPGEKENEPKNPSNECLMENISSESIKSTETISSNLKDNLAAEYVKEGRSRRNRPVISFKEPYLNRKLRRS